MLPLFRGDLDWNRLFVIAGFANVEGSDFLNQMLYLDTKIFMASLNRTYNDMLGMASSVEGSGAVPGS